MKKFIICFLTTFIIISSCFVAFAQYNFPATLKNRLTSYERQFPNMTYIVVYNSRLNKYFVYWSMNSLKIRQFHSVDTHLVIEYSDDEGLLDYGTDSDRSYSFKTPDCSVIYTHNLSYFTVAFLNYNRIKFNLINSIYILLPILISLFAIRKGLLFFKTQISGA